MDVRRIDIVKMDSEVILFCYSTWKNLDEEKNAFQSDAYRPRADLIPYYPKGMSA